MKLRWLSIVDSWPQKTIKSYSSHSTTIKKKKIKNVQWRWKRRLELFPSLRCTRVIKITWCFNRCVSTRLTRWHTANHVKPSTTVPFFEIKKLKFSQTNGDYCNVLYTVKFCKFKLDFSEDLPPKSKSESALKTRCKSPDQIPSNTTYHFVIRIQKTYDTVFIFIGILISSLYTGMLIVV